MVRCDWAVFSVLEMTYGLMDRKEQPKIFRGKNSISACDMVMDIFRVISRRDQTDNEIFPL